MIKVPKKQNLINDLNPVLLMHGMGMSADSWIMHAEKAMDSLPLLLSEAGFDVWVGNSRGTWDYSSHKVYDKK